MNYLLDTCALLWLVNGDARLSPEAVRFCSDTDSKLFVSAVSAWEIAIKAARGKLLLSMAPELWWGRALNRHTLQELPITSKIGIAAAGLEPIHHDPFDRILVATADEHGLKLLSPDHEISRYRKIAVVW